MKYMVLLYGDPADEPMPESPEFGLWMEEFMTVAERMSHVATVLSGEGLVHAAKAVTVRQRGGGGSRRWTVPLPRRANSWAGIT